MTKTAGKTWKGVLTAVLLLAVIPVMLFLAAFCTPPVFSETYYGELGPMYDRLKSAGGPKIVIVGNSAAAFGVDSALIERELHACGQEYTVCCFGLYGTIGSKAMLDMAEGCIKTGDVVIFLPETESRAMSTFTSGTELWRAIDSSGPLLLALAKNNAGKLLAGFTGYVQEKIPYALEGKTASPSGVYARASFDENCVMRARRPENVMPGGYDANTPVSFSDALPDGDFAAYLNRFAEKMRKKGAVFCLSFAPMNERAVTEDGIGPEGFFDALYESLDLRIITDPRTRILGAEWFYDTNFHMNEAGMQMHSLLLVEDIKNLLGIPQGNETEMPRAPALGSMERPVYAGDDSQADCYLYAPWEDGWEITGLSEKGVGLTELILPASHEGKPVRRFAAEAFSGNGRISSVTVSKNVTVLSDGSFFDCSSLEKLILTNPDPSETSVGYGLLDGAERCVICVPKEAFSAYANNYCWGAYNDGRLVRYED